MSTILDVDLDWLNLCNRNDGSRFLKNRTPQEAFDDLMNRANPDAKITMSIEHHEAYKIWDAFVDERRLTRPRHIYHVDEHHDLYNDYQHIDCANFMLFALRQWPKCQTTWVASYQKGNGKNFYWGFHKSNLKKRFATTLKIPNDIGDVDLISITISPDYTKQFVLEDILPHIEEKYGQRIIGQFPTPRKGKGEWPNNLHPYNWTMRGVKK